MYTKILYWEQLLNAILVSNHYKELKKKKKYCAVEATSLLL